MKIITVWQPWASLIAIGAKSFDRGEHANFAWPLTQVERLLPPVEARGAQGFWSYGGVL